MSLLLTLDQYLYRDIYRCVYDACVQELTPTEIDENGNRYWKNQKNRQMHRDGDQPAIIYTNGDRVWYQHGRCHRDGDQPAFIGVDGGQLWYQYGSLML